MYGIFVASRLLGQISYISRFPAARAGSSANFLSVQTWWYDPSRSVKRQISGLQTSRLYLFRTSRIGPNQRYRCYSNESQVEPTMEPSRSDLFYHVVSPPTPISSSLPAFGLSFLSTPPPTAESCAVIGWLPAVSEGEGQEAGLNDFKENRE